MFTKLRTGVENFFRKKFIPINVKTFQIPIFSATETGGCDFVQKRLGLGATFFITECICILFLC